MTSFLAGLKIFSPKSAVRVSTSPPFGAPQVGDVWVDPNDGSTSRWDGGTWIRIKADIVMNEDDALDLFLCLPKTDLRFESETNDIDVTPYGSMRSESVVAVRGSASGTMRSVNPDALPDFEAMARCLAHRVTMTVSQDRIYNVVSDSYQIRGVIADFRTEDPVIVKHLMEAAMSDESRQAAQSEKTRLIQEAHAAEVEKQQEAKRIERERTEQYAEEALF